MECAIDPERADTEGVPVNLELSWRTRDAPAVLATIGTIYEQDTFRARTLTNDCTSPSQQSDTPGHHCNEHEADTQVQQRTEGNGECKAKEPR